MVGTSIAFADITVTVDISNPALGWTQLAIFNGSRDNNAANPIGSFVDSADIINNGDGTYTYTFVGVDRIENLVFMDSDGTDWPVGGRGENLLIRRTDNTGPIEQSTCFVVNEELVSSEGGNTLNVGMRIVTECNDTPTSLQVVSDDMVAIHTDGQIEVTFSGQAKVEMYTAGGVLLLSQIADSRVSYPASNGIYIVRVNGEAWKVLVK